MRSKLSIGPAALVTAAFIGPGTLTLCIMAGVKHGFSLLWAMLLSTAITIFIQNTAARIAWTTRIGLAKSVLKQSTSSIGKLGLSLLLIASIFIGNAAYEAGNLSGALLGIKGVFPVNLGQVLGVDTFLLLLSGLVGWMLWKGSFALLKQTLVAIVIVMSVSFLITAVLTQPNLILVIKGLFIPTFSTDEVLTIVGLLGTTVVPYNLFLHAAMVAQSPNASMARIKSDTFIAVGLGGVISICIIISAASIEGSVLVTASDLGKTLTPLFGNLAPKLMYFGFFAAGLTSAITAPLAAAFVVCECFNLPINGWLYKLVALMVLFTGLAFSTIGNVPLEIIRFAQIANGILLPIVGLFLLWMINNSKLMQGATASPLANVFFILIEIFFVFLGGKSLGIMF